MLRFLSFIASGIGRGAALAGLCGVCGLALGQGAVEQKRSYHLPRGDASITLNQFATAAECPVIFMVAKVQGVQTNAVAGEFSPAEAMDRMLANTDLRAIADATTGAFVITRRPQPSADGPAKAGSPHPPSTTDQTMKRPNLFQRLVAAATLLAAQPADAQTAPTAPAVQANTEPVTLSPFEVHAKEESGYVATHSLVGSRVNTELKDIASQIDVLTPEFLQDIGATSIADAVAYSSNFGGPNDQNIGPNDGIANISLEGRARGMDAATVSTDFYTTNLPIDFYNVERLNLAYGAQSVLFGLGNAGGVLDAAAKRALMRNRSSADVRFDSWGSSRGTLDFNRELVPQKLAVRLVTLVADSHQFTEGGQQQSLRGYGTITYKPFVRTTVRASYEQLAIDTQRATNYLSYDYVSPWIARGKPLYDDSQGNTGIAANDPLLSRNTNALRVLAYGSGDVSYMPWNGTALTKGPHEIPGAINLSQRSLLDGSIYPTDRDPRVLSRENQIKGRQVRAAIEQRVTSDLVFELGFNYERRDEQAGGTFDNAESVNIRIDPNRYLPGGTAARPGTTPNPNAGKLYIETFPHGRTARDFTEEARLTGFYEFSAARHMGENWRWLGRHRLASLLSRREDRNESQEDRAIVQGETPFTTGEKLSNSRLLRTRYYLDSPRDTASKGNYEAGAVPGAGLFGPWVINDPATNTPVRYVMFDNPEGSGFAPVGTKVKVDTAMAALQSFFWRDRLNVFVGLRQDHVKTYYFDNVSTTRRDQVAPGDHLALFPKLTEANYTSDPAAVKTAMMRTYGVVFHPLRWASLFYNTSENTSLPPGRFGPFGNALQGVGSDGFDYGVRVSLLADRVSLRLNFFEDNQKDFWNNPFTQLRNFSANIEQRLRGTDRPAGLAPVAASTFDPIANPLELYRSLTDKSTKGLDLVMVANLTPNWTLRATVGRQENLVKKRGSEWIDWIEQRLPVWQQAGGRGWDNITLSSSDSRSIHQYYTDVILPQITAQKLAKGTVRGREREWRANVFTNYHFKEGWLRGFNLGGGVRWWSEGFTGHGGTVVPGIANLVDDTNIVFRHAKPQTFTDLVLGYRRNFHFAGRNREIDFRLNVRNLFDEDELEVSRTDQLGVDYEYVRVAPRQLVFSATVNF